MTSGRAAASEPSYRRVARELRTAILQGQYADGARLPTEEELADRYALSRQTIRRAFQELVADDMVYRVPGRGTFPVPRGGGRYLRQLGSIDDLMNLAVDTTMEVVSPLQRRLDVDVAGRLRLASDVVYTVVFRRLHEGVAFCLTSVNVSPAIAELLKDRPEVTTLGGRSDTTVIGLYDARLPEPIAEADQSITATAAPSHVAALLGAPSGEPVLRVDRLYLTTSGEPVELSVSYFLPEHYSYRLRLRRNVY